MRCPAHAAVAVHPRTHNGLAQRIPERHLIGGEHRPTEVFFERRTHANGVEAIPAQYNRFGCGRHLRVREGVQLRGIQLGTRAERIGML